MTRPSFRHALVVLGAALMVAAPAAAQTTPWLTADQWSEDLAVLDATIRDRHPDPFTRTPESVWVARLADAALTLPEMDRTAATAEMIRLTSLLDTHSGIFPDESGFGFYAQDEWTVMGDGLYVTAASDPAHLGARILSIGDEPTDLALARLRPYMNADNESAMISMLSWMAQVPELLQAAGVITDVTRPDIVLRLRDGSVVTTEPQPMTVDEAGGVERVRTVPGVELPMAASRRDEAIWWTVDTDHHAFILGYDHPGEPTTAAVADLMAALDSGAVDRVVVDLRYAPGGGYHPSLPLVQALAAEPRINRQGHLAIITGRDSISATTALASAFEQRTEATFVGEPTPARPNTNLDEITFTLPNSGLTMHIPTTLEVIAGPDDLRDAIYPDIAVPLLSTDWFTGRDRALEVAMTLP
jgi:hypothetical protein